MNILIDYEKNGNLIKKIMRFCNIDWSTVERNLSDVIKEMQKSDKGIPVYGQDLAARNAVKRLRNNGVILADDVGLGKTRVALMLMESVARSGGTVAVVAPANLIHQWIDESRLFFDSLKFHSLSENPISLRSVKKTIEIANELDGSLCKKVKDKVHWSIISQGFRLVHNKYISGNRKIEREQEKILKEMVKNIVKEKNIPNDNSNKVPWLLGCIIGKIDFLIIDEAHKSREVKNDCEEVEDKEKKKLPFLLEEIIQKKADSRCLCMTATPVEMGAEQWKTLLDRCGHLQNREKIFSHIDDFSKNMEIANRCPEDTQKIDELIKSAKCLHKDLDLYVVRRRRTNQYEYKNLIKKFPNSFGSHPHREIESPVLVKTDHLNKMWKSVVLAMEGISCAAKNSNASYKEKLLRCRYAAGMVNTKIVKNSNEKKELDSTNKVIKEINKRDEAKANRLKYWKENLAKVVENDESFLLEHPRIQAAADKIEELSKNMKKVLVFGSFIKPMEALRDELNYRYILRRMIGGNPVSLPISSTDALKKTKANLWNAYNRLKQDKKWNFWSGKKSFNRRFDKEKEKIKNLNNGLDKNIFKDKKWLNLLRNHEKYDEKIKNFLEKLLKDKESKNIIDKIHWDLVEKIYQSENSFFFTKKTFRHDCEVVADMLIDIIKDYISYCTKDGKRVSFANFKKILKDVELRGRHDNFCSLLTGSDDMNTRRPLLTRRFNSAKTFPQILIAQSRVGREGLNLHKACSQVVIFNTEWNPAVVEQEIGRVDRISSLWYEEAKKWNSAKKRVSTQPPMIKVVFIVFDETYDRYQYEVFVNRRKELSSQLFGTLLDEVTLAKLPKEYIERHKVDLTQAFDFEPKK